MEADRWAHTKNPIRHLAANVRYRTGLWVEDYMRKHGEWEDWHNKDHKIRRAIWEYAIDAEGASNCIEMPLLGKIIKWDQRKNKTMHKWHDLRSKATTKAEKAKVQKLWDKMKHEEAMKDKWLKFEDPEYITKAEEQEDFRIRLAHLKEHGEFPKTPPLLQGGKRFTQEEWDKIQAEKETKNPPIAL